VAEQVLQHRVSQTFRKSTVSALRVLTGCQHSAELWLPATKPSIFVTLSTRPRDILELMEPLIINHFRAAYNAFLPSTNVMWGRRPSARP